MSRVMLSSQRLWPRSWSALVAFMVSPCSGIRFCSQQRGEIPGEDIADVLDPHIGHWVRRQDRALILPCHGKTVDIRSPQSFLTWLACSTACTTSCMTVSDRTRALIQAAAWRSVRHHEPAADRLDAEFPGTRPARLLRRDSS